MRAVDMNIGTRLALGFYPNIIPLTAAATYYCKSVKGRSADGFLIRA